MLCYIQELLKIALWNTLVWWNPGQRNGTWQNWHRTVCDICNTSCRPCRLLRFVFDWGLLLGLSRLLLADSPLTSASLSELLAAGEASLSSRSSSAAEDSGSVRCRRRRRDFFLSNGWNYQLHIIAVWRRLFKITPIITVYERITGFALMITSGKLKSITLMWQIDINWGVVDMNEFLVHNKMLILP